VAHTGGGQRAAPAARVSVRLCLNHTRSIESIVRGAHVFTRHMRHGHTNGTPSPWPVCSPRSIVHSTDRAADARYVRCAWTGWPHTDTRDTDRAHATHDTHQHWIVQCTHHDPHPVYRRNRHALHTRPSTHTAQIQIVDRSPHTNGVRS